MLVHGEHQLGYLQIRIVQCAHRRRLVICWTQVRQCQTAGGTVVEVVQIIDVVWQVELVLVVH